jgi:hypothetical protein
MGITVLFYPKPHSAPMNHGAIKTELHRFAELLVRQRLASRANRSQSGTFRDRDQIATVPNPVQGFLLRFVKRLHVT